MGILIGMAIVIVGQKIMEKNAKAKQKEIKKEWEQKHLGGGLEKTISQKLRESKGSGTTAPGSAS